MLIIRSDEMNPMDMLMRSIGKTDISDTVQKIIENVKTRKDEALFEYAEKYDHVSMSSLEVNSQTIEQACFEVDDELIRVMEKAAVNIEAFHRNQVRKGFRMNCGDGVFMGQKVSPIEKIGLYIPGGTASYPSTVFMNAIPARLAGCSEIIMVSPPGPDGRIPSVILAAAKMAGVTRVFSVGGAQAIAALAYGTETIPRVDKIVGPGNAYVAEAKRAVFGQVAIDMIAGPSEILILSDGKTSPKWLAADLLSQAEHDAMACAVLITDSIELANKVNEEVEKQIQRLPRENIARKSIENNGKIILVNDLEEGANIVNKLAPEHLELCVDEPELFFMDFIRNAGSVFLGRYTPESLGDYLAGPNHTLPTSGTARFSSPLSVDDFIKKIQFSHYSQHALAGIAQEIACFARAEGLEAHARSALIRGDKT